MTTFGLGLYSIGLNMLFCFLLRHADSYNLDISHAIPLSGPNGSFFGYSVLLHKHQQQTWVIVGAPVANSKFNQAVRNPGAIYKCKITDKKDCEQIQLGVMSDMPCGRHCSAEVENQWLGVSLSRREQDGLVLACGHRWKNVFFTKKDDLYKLPHGVCYKLESDLNQSSPLIPCYRDHQKQFDNDYASCQAGISNVLIGDLIVMGAPGTFYWTGSVFVHNISSQVTSAYLDDNVVLYGSYLGYSVSAGHFLHPDSTEVVGGAPQYGQTGRAYIFSIESSTLSIISEVKGQKLGSYFGATVCAVDLNTDGLSDLLVGAPMFSAVREEGRVHIYMNQGQANMKEMEFTLAGKDSYAARFGESITSLGDIDGDGYPDVAVGAPQEDDLHGAIYIYNGRKTGLERYFSQRIAGSVLGSAFKMFGQSVSGGIDVDENDYPDVAVGAFLSDSAVVLRSRAVVVVEATILLPPSVNRTHALCTENGQPAICLKTTVCFQLHTQRVSGLIEILYNLTADVKHIEGLQSRFFFTTNGTALSNATAGSIKTRHGNMTCVTHLAFLRRDIRDIFTPIHFELQYELGKHNVVRGNSESFPSLRPMLQRGGKYSNLLTNKTVFTRYCAWANCSTNLQVSAQLLLPRTHRDMPYVALGEGKTILLNVTLSNAGDAAFLPMLHLRYPRNLYFIKVLDAEEKYVSCKIAEEEKTSVGLDCSVGNLFFNALAKVNISFLLDVSADSEPGDLNIIINATRENFENEDLLHDNIVNLTLLLRYGVNLNIHGFVSRTDFVFGDFEDPHCSTERFNYTFKVVNVGPSISHGTRVEIDIPKALAPYPYRLLNILDIQSSSGWCYIQNSTDGTSSTHGNMYGSQRASTIDSVWLNVTTTTDSYWMNSSSTTHPYWTNTSSTTDTNWTSTSYWANVRNWTSVIEDECDLPDSNPLNELFFFFFSKRSRRHMYCMKEDALCLYAVCELGDMDIGKDVTIEMEVEMNSGVLDISPGRHGVMLLETTAVISPKKDPFIWFLKEDPITVVVLEAHHSHKLKPVIGLFIIVASLFLGILILALLVICMWKSGFFKSKYEEKMANIRRHSWDY
ncbi:integrin alpha-4 isoform X1 [Salmo trutta]|uniref:Integrin alpha-4-like n=1 Tax=Salmo trutta TaxID=8032 RepID=A0A674D1Q0_SALTR|nr:integrin alpha-4-like isoform X1 [Salmo trutta]